MYIITPLKFELNDKALNELSFNAVKDVNVWLNHWTAKANYKSMVCTNHNKYLDYINKDFNIPDFISSLNVNISHFKITVQINQVDENNTFWDNSEQTKVFMMGN